MKFMKIITIILLVLFSCNTSIYAQKPVRIIYDTDMDLDVDDAGALALLHALEDNGEAKILGVVCNAPTPYGATTIAAINEYYGHPEIPIGDMPMEDYVYDKSFSKRYNNYTVSTPHGNFNLPVFRQFNTNIKSRKDVWDGVKLYRKLLAESPDRSVTIAAVGLLTILDDLLISQADEFSSLNGVELVKLKVNQLVCMAGGNQPAPGRDHFNWGFDGRGDAERISKNWPTTLVIMPLGGKIVTGARLSTETPANNPVRVAYEYFLKPTGAKDRSSWDQIACLYAVRGAGDLFTEKKGQRLDVDYGPTDVTYKWRESKEGESKHILLKQAASDEEFKKVVEDLMVQPPQPSKRKL